MICNRILLLLSYLTFFVYSINFHANVKIQGTLLIAKVLIHHYG